MACRDRVVTVPPGSTLWGSEGPKTWVWVSPCRGMQEARGGERAGWTVRVTCREGPQGGAGVARAVTRPAHLTCEMLLSETHLAESGFGSHLSVPVSIVGGQHSPQSNTANPLLHLSDRLSGNVGAPVPGLQVSHSPPATPVLLEAVWAAMAKAWVEGVWGPAQPPRGAPRLAQHLAARRMSWGCAAPTHRVQRHGND